MCNPTFSMSRTIDQLKDKRDVGRAPQTNCRRTKNKISDRTAGKRAKNFARSKLRYFNPVDCLKNGSSKIAKENPGESFCCNGAGKERPDYC